MKCKYCYAQIPENPRKGRCSDCGASIMKKANKKFRIPWFLVVFCGIFFFAGALITFAGIQDALEYRANKEHYAQVDAVITHIDKKTTYDSINEEYDTDYTVYVSYQYGGVEYQWVKLNYYHSGMHEGDGITVEIDTRSPDTVVSDAGFVSFMGIGFMAIGGVIFYFAGIAPQKKKTVHRT